jgi:hypothetical protein
VAIPASVLQTIEGHLARLVLLEAEQPEFDAGGEAGAAASVGVVFACGARGVGRFAAPVPATKSARVVATSGGTPAPCSPDRIASYFSVGAALTTAVFAPDIARWAIVAPCFAAADAEP